MTDQRASAVDRQRRWWRRWPLLVVLGVIGLAFAVLLVWQVPLWLNPQPSPAPVASGADGIVQAAQTQAAAALQAAHAQAIATTRAGFAAGLAGFAALFAALGTLWFNAHTLRINQQTLEENRRAQTEALRLQTRALDLQNEGHLTDRYSRAVEQLGESGGEKLAIRLGGIYALQRIAADSGRGHTTVVEVLSAFARASSNSGAAPTVRGETPAPLSIDVQAAVNVLGGLPQRDGVGRADLRGAQLQAAQLEGANLNGAQLQGAQLEGANLNGAQLQGADLQGAGLRMTHLRDARLQKAVLGTWAFETLLQAQWPDSLGSADAELADLTGADLRGASLYGVKLRSARLVRADLSQTDLRSSNLEHALLLKAHLEGAKFGSPDANVGQDGCGMAAV